MSNIVMLRIGFIMTIAAMLAQGVGVAAGAMDYKGHIVDEFQRPIAGAKVTMIGAHLFAISDTSGVFTLKGPAPSGGRTNQALNPLEFTADGFFARTLVPSSTKMRNIRVTLDSTAAPVEGQPVDIGRFGYEYRRGAPNNPCESKWLLPYLSFNLDNACPLLCGFLWEGPRMLDRVEVEFPKIGGPAPDLNELKVFGNSKHWWNSKGEELIAGGKPTGTPRGTTMFAFLAAKSMENIVKLCVVYGGTNQSIGIPTVRVYARGKRWGKPQPVEIEWGFDRDSKSFDGRIEAFNGYVGKIEPLESGNGIEAAGEHHWRESAGANGRRGIRATIYGAADRSANITVWTGCGTVTFAPADLAKGPILVPGMGVFIAQAGGGVTARQFQEKLAADKKETLRQRARKHAEQSWAGAMGTFYQLDKLPAFPIPPMESPMQIDVPEKELVAQWRLGAWHLTRHSKKINDRIYTISIVAGGCYLAQESWQVIKALDLLGMHDFAEGGLNYWIFADRHGSNPKFCDNDGYLIREDGYDNRHTLGHGNILETAAFHYRLTESKAWLKEAAPILKKACEWTLRQRKYWNNQVPKGSWFYGLLPPLSTGDFTEEGQVLYLSSIAYYGGLKAMAEVLAGAGVEGAAGMLPEVADWRKDLRAAGAMSAAFARVVQVGDGTYCRYIPFMPYLRAPAWDAPNAWYSADYMESVFGGLRFAKEGIYGVNEPITQEMLDVMEERWSKVNTYGAVNPVPSDLGPTLAKLASDDAWFNTGAYCGLRDAQAGYESLASIYLVLDEAPMFLRAMYNAYAAEIMPAKGYIFSESFFGGHSPDKTFEEGAFLERVRMMLVMEDGRSLWLARATPRAWLNQGQKISVKNAPTFFGTLSYEIVSDVDHGMITATVQMPARNATHSVAGGPARNAPESVLLRLRHPQSASIKSVAVNGKPWTDFDRDKEFIRLKGLAGTVAVQVNY